MAAKKTATKRVTTKKKAAGSRKSTAAKSPTKSPAKAPRKKAAGKSASKKKVVAKKAASKKKPAPKKPAPKKPAPKKAAASKKKSTKRSAGATKPARKVAPAEPEQTPVVKRKRAAKRAAPIIDPLTPRSKKRPVQKLKVIRPGRKKAQKNISKPKAYRALTVTQKARYHAQLLAMRDRVSGQISSLKKESLTRADEVNIEEDGTDAFDRQFALNLASSENEALIKIDAALTLLQEGAFGKCQECGGGIESARLKAIPFTRNCIACQSELEKHRPGYRPSLKLD